MILKPNQRVNVIVRAIIIEEDHLIVTRWKDLGNPFLIGGRVDFGESLLNALPREIKEETGANLGGPPRLLYFSENIFTASDGNDYHELGWYYLVQTDRMICPDDVIIQNPDDPRLEICRLPLTEEGLTPLLPPFLGPHLLKDRENNFSHCPKSFYNRQPDWEEETKLFSNDG